MAERLKRQRLDLLPKRGKKSSAVADYFKGLRPTVDENTTRINHDQIQSVEELCVSVPTLARCLDGLISSVFGKRQGLSSVVENEVCELEETMSIFVEEFWLPVLREACRSLIMFGMAALTTKPLKELASPEELSKTAFILRARAEKMSFLAFEQRVPTLLPLDLVCIAANGFHTVDGHPDAVVSTLYPPDSRGNLTTTLNSACYLYSYVGMIGETTAAAWAKLADPPLTIQKRRGPSGSNSLDTDSLFFDCEAREMKAGDLMQDAVSRADIMSFLLKSFNQRQTTVQTPYGKEKKSTKPDNLVVVPSESEVVSGTASVSAIGVSSYVDLLKYADDAVEDLCLFGKGTDNTAAGVQARTDTKERHVGRIRSELNRVLMVLSAQASCRRLCITPDLANNDLDVDSIANLYKVGLLTQEEARSLLSRAIGCSLD